MNKKEKYEMKMAKYNANKARKAEKESRIKELERVKELAKKQNGSTADVEKHIYRYICPTLLDGDIEAKMTKIANDFFEKRMMAVAVPCVYNDKEILLSCVNYGSNTADVGFECVTFGIIDFMVNSIKILQFHRNISLCFIPTCGILSRMHLRRP